MSSARSGCPWSLGPKCGHRRCGCGRGGNPTGRGVWFVDRVHLRCTRGIFTRETSTEVFSWHNVAAFGHEVVQIAVCIQRQIVQDDMSRRAWNGWSGTPTLTFRIPPRNLSGALWFNNGQLPRPSLASKRRRSCLRSCSSSVEVVLVSRPTAANSKDVQEPLGFRLLPARVVSVGFGDGTSRELVLSWEVGGAYSPRKLG